MSNPSDDQKVALIVDQIKKEVEEEQITEQFPEMSIQELTDILGLTVKKDNTNKLLTFFTMLSAFTEDSQLNLSFNAPSSSGKSYIPLEIANLFPKECVIELGSCSPTAFFHENGQYNKETNIMSVVLEGKIIIFLDQQNNQLLEKLRPMLSHDRKEIIIKITDKNMRGGNRTKTVILRGFPAVIFCTAGLRIDEQEATRCILLSPEIDEEKVRQGVQAKIQRESNKELYAGNLEANSARQDLIRRIKAIQQAKMLHFIIGNPQLFEEMVFACSLNLRPRMQRDVGKISSLIKALALFNFWSREKDDDALVASDDDIRTAFALWKEIAESQDLNLPPYVLDLYKQVIVPEFEKKNKNIMPDEAQGLTRNEIRTAYYTSFSRMIEDWQLRQIISMLETAGLIAQEKSQKDARTQLVYPTYFKAPKNNNEGDAGVQEMFEKLL